MTEITESSRPTMDGPANYKITILGQLDPKWARRLEGMNATSVALSDGNIETTLQGRLADQAALSGVLNTLYELHLPVLSAVCVDSE
jgi:hypothetical protein